MSLKKAVAHTLICIQCRPTWLKRMRQQNILATTKLILLHQKFLRSIARVKLKLQRLVYNKFSINDE